MLILGIETSCDETSAAVVRNGREVLSCVIASSRKDFELTGGVIPEEAARKQQEVILAVIAKALSDAHASAQTIDAIAVTAYPGLIGSLLVGTFTARSLSAVWQKPLIPIHHTLGHLSSVWLTKTNDAQKSVPVFPLMTLSVSGGHSDIWYRTAHARGSCIGTTRDDAAGEAFDKGAVMLGLPYPGGPALAALAESGDEHQYSFPRPLHDDPAVAFSFSGLKTSLKYLLRDLGHEPSREERASIAASYQYAIIQHLEDKLTRALDLYPDTQELHLVGGVSANTRLRIMSKDLCEKNGIQLRYPEELRYCTDNGAMIAAAGEFLVHENPSMIDARFETSASLSLQDIFLELVRNRTESWK
jgi:N6-L-threonylcarbamoyladenine synthase